VSAEVLSLPADTQRAKCSMCLYSLQPLPVHPTDILSKSSMSCIQNESKMSKTFKRKPILLISCVGHRQCHCRFIQRIVAKLTPLMRSMCAVLFTEERLQCVTTAVNNSICMSGSCKLSRNQFHVIGPRQLASAVSAPTYLFTLRMPLSSHLLAT